MLFYLILMFQDKWAFVADAIDVPLIRRIVELRTYRDCAKDRKENLPRRDLARKSERPTAADFPSVTLGRAQTISGNAAIVLS